MKKVQTKRKLLIVGIICGLAGIAVTLTLNSKVSVQVQAVPHASRSKNCYSTTYDPHKTYQIGDEVYTLDTCVIDGDGCWVSIINNNKGREPSEGWDWIRSCGLVGPTPMGSLIDEYIKLRDENTKLKAQLEQRQERK